MIVSFGYFAPTMRPAMFLDTMVSCLTLKSAEKVAPFSSTGLKSRVWACFFRASKSRPAFLNRSTATSRWIQASTCGCVLAGSLRTMSNIVLVLEFLTVAQPYEAGAVSWTIRTPAAPRRAASSYL